VAEGAAPQGPEVVLPQSPAKAAEVESTTKPPLLQLDQEEVDKGPPPVSPETQKEEILETKLEVFSIFTKIFYNHVN
jgi:hypothetical protein